MIPHLPIIYDLKRGPYEECEADQALLQKTWNQEDIKEVMQMPANV